MGDVVQRFLSEYYPPVYIVAKCLDYLRPFIKEVSLREDANGNHCSLPTVRTTIQGAKEGPAPAKPRTPTTTKTFFKKINPFSQNSSEENKTKAPPGNEPEKSQRYFNQYQLVKSKIEKVSIVISTDVLVWRKRLAHPGMFGRFSRSSRRSFSTRLKPQILTRRTTPTWKVRVG